MLFAKLFGGRGAKEPADLPPSPAQPRVATQAVAPPAAAPVKPTPERREEHPHTTGKDEPRGFDPYNSGAFKKSDAWERINRR